MSLPQDTREAMVADARRWIKTPYHHKGRKFGVGVDCGGLIYEVYNKFLGPLRPFPSDYPPDWTLHRGDEIYLNFLREYMVQVSQPALGGLTMWRFGRCFGHGTIVSGPNEWIHAWGRNGQGDVRASAKTFFGRREHIHYDVSPSWLCQQRPRLVLQQ
jgi:cell wall-associated NlpC family hydrolase